MTVFFCAKCGARLTAGLLRLPAVPGRPAESERDPGSGLLASTVPRGHYAIEPDAVLVHPEDVPGLRPLPHGGNSLGCCGPAGVRGPNSMCACGSRLATLRADCCGPYELRLDPVRTYAFAPEGADVPGPGAPALPVAVPGVCVRILPKAGGCGSPFAHVVADFEPPEPGGGTEVLNAVPEDLLPPEYLPALRTGLLQGLDGVQAAVLLTGGSFHDVDSSERGYRLAGAEAGRAALIGAGLRPPEEARHLRWTTWPGRPEARGERTRHKGP